MLLRESVRRYLADRNTVEQHRAMRGKDAGFDPRAWQLFAELGWLSLPFASVDGGLDGGAVDLMVFAEALGAGVVREPYLITVVTCGGLLSHGGSAAQRRRYIPAIIDGRAQWAFAFAESGSGYDFERIATTAQLRDGTYVLSGCKLAVLNAHCADHIIVTARVPECAGVSLFVVDRNAHGVSCEPFVAMDGSRGAHLTFTDVVVAADSMLWQAGDGLRLIAAVIDKSIVAIGAEALGAMQSLLDTTVEYTKTRQQFGQSLSKFQVLQHRMADMYMKVEETRSLLLHAAIRVQEDSPQKSAACAALKVKVAEAGRFVSQQAVQLHGGMGMTDELVVGHHYKRLLLLSKLYGDEQHHLQRFVVFTAGRGVDQESVE